MSSYISDGGFLFLLHRLYGLRGMGEMGTPTLYLGGGVWVGYWGINFTLTDWYFNMLLTKQSSFVLTRSLL